MLELLLLFLPFLEVSDGGGFGFWSSLAALAEITGAATSVTDNKASAKNLLADLFEDLRMHLSPDCIPGTGRVCGRHARK
jgi:hypothetical protein